MTVDEYKAKIKENAIENYEEWTNIDALFNHVSDEVLAEMLEKGIKVRDATFYCLLSSVLKVKVTKEMLP